MATTPTVTPQNITHRQASAVADATEELYDVLEEARRLVAKLEVIDRRFAKFSVMVEERRAGRFPMKQSEMQTNFDEALLPLQDLVGAAARLAANVREVEVECGRVVNDLCPCVEAD